MCRQAREKHEPMKGRHYQRLHCSCISSCQALKGPACHPLPSQARAQVLRKQHWLDWRLFPAECNTVLGNPCTKCCFFFLIKAIHRVCGQVQTQGTEASRPSVLTERERNRNWGFMDTRRQLARWWRWVKPWRCATMAPP